MTEQRSDKINNHKDNEQLEKYINEGKKVANDLYTSGLDKMNLDEKDVAKYTEELSETIKKNPIKSVLIAGSIGFLLANIFKK